MLVLYTRKIAALLLLLLVAASQPAGRCRAEEKKGDPVAPPATAATVAKTAVFQPVSLDTVKPYFGQKFLQGPTSSKRIAFTFDDGPSAKLTPQVVEILKKENVTATFFMLGECVEQYPELAKMVSDAGFEVGCHSMTHPPLNKKSLEVVQREIVGSQLAVEKATGKKPTLFRPPFGLIGQHVKTVCAENNMVIVNWSIDPRDWAPKSTAESVHAHIMKHAHGGAIVCMHDIHERTLIALPKMIQALKAMGYEFTTVSQLIAEEEKEKAAGPKATGAFVGNGSEAASLPSAIALSDSGVK